MMSTRRTLLTFGALVATVALLIPVTAAAQPPTAPTGAGPVTVVDYDSVVVQWTPAGSPADTTGYEVGYVVATAAVQAGVSNSATYNAVGPMMMMATGATTATLTLNGLMPGTQYIFAVRAVNTATTTAGGTDRNGDWVLVADSDGTADGYQGHMTAAIPAPAMPTNVELTAYNGAIGVEWDGADDDPIGVHHYKLRATFSGGTLEQGTKDGMTTMHMFMDLMNGTEYSITVETIGMNPGSMEADMDGDGMPDRRSGATMAMKATPMEDLDDPPMTDDDDDMDDDDDDDDDMMATPALPLLGILALFAGLLAAGRARLRG